MYSNWLLELQQACRKNKNILILTKPAKLMSALNLIRWLLKS